MFNINKEVLNHENKLIDLRRYFHMYPELGYEEYNTSKKIKEYLEELKIETEIVSKTGVVGLLKGKNEGQTVLLRADIDALPQTEEVEVDYKSKNEGKMHACGHDGHIAMLLIAAKILSEHREEINGTIKFVFQPNEEEAGALDMIKEGILEDPKVDGAFAAHLWTPIDSGKVGIITGPLMAANEEFEITIEGKSGHTSAPHTAIDPIMISSSIIQEIQTIQTRYINPLTPIAIMIGRIKGGSGRNIIPDKVTMGGTIRFLFEDEEREKKLLLEKFEQIIKNICEYSGAKYNLKFIPSNPSVKNDEKMVNLVKKGVAEVLGSEKIETYSCMAGEDFAEFTHRVPSALCFIGTGNSKKDTRYPHHHPKFNIDEDTLKTGVELHIRNALNFLNNR